MKKALLILVLLVAYLSPVAAQTAADGLDSTLVAYYRWCNRHKQDPEMPLKADTMFRLAEQQQNPRMQAVALCLKTDYYYFTANLDSLKVWVERTQQFARQHNQLVHYYFVWTRLIGYYTTFSKYTLAQYELERYRNQAISDDYKPGIAEAYKQLGHIYRTKGLSEQAAEAYAKGVEQIEQNSLKGIDVSYIYLQLGEVYTLLNDFNKADEAFAKARKTILLPEHILRIKVAEAKRYAVAGQYVRANQLLNEVQKEDNGDIPESKINEVRISIYKRSGELHKALAITNRLLEIYDKEECQNDSTKISQHYFRIPILGYRAEINYRLGDYKAAAEDLFQEINLMKEKYETDNQQTLGEFATLLDVERLDREKIAAQQQVQEERLRRSRVFEIGLVIILLLATAFIVILTRLNRHLAHAKRAAEEANRMKSVFIRNITHEINTPLNSIVGFAELASTAEDNDPERSAYIDIIWENSGNLQKLVNDVLYIADLESSDNPPATAPVEINVCCLECIHNIAKSEQQQVEIRFRPGREQFRFQTSGLLLSKALTELLRNAVRFTDPAKGATLSYELSEDERSITFAVTDFGPGVPEGEQEHIFERFVKLDTFTQGLGLGLSVSRLIARALGGDVRLDTGHAPGARFLLTIPVK